MSETPQGYSGPLPPNYVQSSAPQTPNLGLTLTGQDPIIAYNFVLIDNFAAGGGGTTVSVNGSTVSSPNFNNTTPAAQAGFTNITWQVSGSNVSAEVLLPANTPAVGGQALASYNSATGAFTTVPVGTGTVTGTGTTNTFTIWTGSTAVGNSTIATQPANTIGNGTALYLQSPTPASAIADVEVHNQFSGGYEAYVQAAVGNLGRTALFSTYKSHGANLAAAPLGVVSNDTLGLFEFNGYDGTNYSGRNFSGQPGSSLTAVATETWTATAHGSVFVLATNANGTVNQQDGFLQFGGSAPLASFPAIKRNAANINFRLGDDSADTGLIASIINATTGFRVSGAATSGNVLRGNGTNFVSAQLAIGDLGNIAGGTVVGNTGTSAGAPAATIAPVLGIPGTSTGSLAIASATASGKFTITAPASAATPTLTLPTTSNVLAGQFAGDNVIFTSTLQTASAAGTLTPSLLTQTQKTFLAGPTSGSAATPTFRVIASTDLPAGTGTVTSVTFTGDGTVLSSTPSGAVTTSGTLTATLANAGGGTVLGNNTTSSAAPAYTTAPVLGIPGTSNGSIALASSTASGKYTITAPANAATPTLTLPTTSNVLAGQFAGDGVVYSASLVTASAAGTLTLPSPSNQTANTVFAGPTSGGAASPTFRALVAGDIPNTTITPLWNNLQNATGALTLANAGNATTFNQTSAVNWTWANTTAATSSVSQSSPIFNINGTYWTGAASATDSWTIQDAVTNGTNGASTLTFTHTGSSGTAAVSIPGGNLSLGATGVGGSITFFGASSGSSALTFPGNSTQMTWAGNTISISGTGTYQGAASTTLSALGGSVTLKATGNATTNSVGIDVLPANSWTATAAGVQINTQSRGTFAPTSGSTNFTGIISNPTINQTGGANGTIRCLASYPVNTALVGTEYLLALGTSSATGPSGTLTDQFLINNSGVVTNYAGTATVAQGMPSEIAISDLTAQTAAITATSLTASAPRTGRYRVSFSATITTASDISSVLGGTNGFQVIYTSPTDSVAKTTVSGNSITSAANTTSTAIADTLMIYAKTGTAIQFKFDYTDSHTSTAMAYEIHTTLEAL